MALWGLPSPAGHPGFMERSLGLILPPQECVRRGHSRLSSHVEASHRDTERPALVPTNPQDRILLARGQLGGHCHRLCVSLSRRHVPCQTGREQTGPAGDVGKPSTHCSKRSARPETGGLEKSAPCLFPTLPVCHLSVPTGGDFSLLSTSSLVMGWRGVGSAGKGRQLPWKPEGLGSIRSRRESMPLISSERADLCAHAHNDWTLGLTQ